MRYRCATPAQVAEDIMDCRELTTDDKTNTPPQKAQKHKIKSRRIIKRSCERATTRPCGATIELTDDDLRDIDGAASRIPVQGERYPEAVEKKTGI
jgi:hypothetical protein